MTETLEKGQDLVNSIKESGKVDYRIGMHMDSSVAIFGDLMAKNSARIDALPADQQYAEVQKLAMKSAELSPLASMTGATGLVKADIQVLIDDSAKLDEKGHEGEHLKKWGKDVAAAVKDVNFSKVYNENGQPVSPLDAQGEMSRIGTEKLQEIKNTIRASAEENISPDFKTQSLEQNLVANIRNNDGKAAPDDGKTKKKGAFDDVSADDAKDPGTDWLKVIMMVIGMLLGIDLSGMFGGTGKDPAAQQQQQQQALDQLADKDIVALKPELENKIQQLSPAADNLTAGKYTQADLDTVAKFTGNKAPEMAQETPEKAKDLGTTVTTEIFNMRNGAKTEEQARKDIGDHLGTPSVQPEKGASITPQKDAKTAEASAVGDRATEALAGMAIPGGSEILGAIHTFKNLDFNHLEELAKNMPQLDPNAAPKPTLATTIPSVPNEGAAKGGGKGGAGGVGA